MGRIAESETKATAARLAPSGSCRLPSVISPGSDTARVKGDADHPGEAETVVSTLCSVPIARHAELQRAAAKVPRLLTGPCTFSQVATRAEHGFHFPGVGRSFAADACMVHTPAAHACSDWKAQLAVSPTFKLLLGEMLFVFAGSCMCTQRLRV